jgi:hypothetical protein
LRCETALAAARWAQDVAIPLSRKLGRGDLTVIDQGTGTLCRPRADGEMSEHAWGNALDVMGFRFSDGEPIPVQPAAATARSTRLSSERSAPAPASTSPLSSGRAATPTMPTTFISTSAPATGISASANDS